MELISPFNYTPILRKSQVFSYKNIKRMKYFTEKTTVFTPSFRFYIVVSPQWLTVRICKRRDGLGDTTEARKILRKPLANTPAQAESRNSRTKALKSPRAWKF